MTLIWRAQFLICRKDDPKCLTHACNDGPRSHCVEAQGVDLSLRQGAAPIADNAGPRLRGRRAACKRLGLRQIFTRPYTPKTNGKAERFIQTALREWAYARAYHNSDQRSAKLPYWLHRYNWHRPHGSLKANTPISRLGLSEDNLLRQLGPAPSMGLRRKGTTA
jgi:transposase InsO family protein